MSRIKKILIAFDQLLAVIFFAKAQPESTFSSMCWKWHITGNRSWPYKMVDKLFWFDPNHCETSYIEEQKRLNKLLKG